MKIGVYGSATGEIQNAAKVNARVIGRRTAELGHTLVTGGCPGLPYEAVLGARGLNGLCIAYSPAVDMDDHINRYHFPTGFSDYKYVPKDYEHVNDDAVCKKYRNVQSVAAVDAAIFISGRIGSMNEFTIAYDFGKNIGILKGSGGITERAIDILLKDAAKESEAKIIWSPNPVRLVDGIVELCNKKR